MPEGRVLSFAKSQRLTRASEFERVKQEGCGQRGKLMLLAALSVQNAGASRAGFVTTRRLGNATVRNRVRRRLREIVRRHQHDLREDFGLCSSPGALLRMPVIARWKMSGCVWQSALLF